MRRDAGELWDVLCVIKSRFAYLVSLLRPSSWLAPQPVLLCFISTECMKPMLTRRLHNFILKWNFFLFVILTFWWILNLTFYHPSMQTYVCSGRACGIISKSCRRARWKLWETRARTNWRVLIDPNPRANSSNTCGVCARDVICEIRQT